MKVLEFLSKCIDSNISIEKIHEKLFPYLQEEGVNIYSIWENGEQIGEVEIEKEGGKIISIYIDIWKYGIFEF